MPSSTHLGQDSQLSLAGSSKRQPVPLGSLVPHRAVLPSRTQCPTMPSPVPAKPSPPASPVWHQGLLGEQALPRRLQAGHPSLPLSPPTAVTYCPAQNTSALPCIQNIDPASNFYLFTYLFTYCLSLEPPAWLSLHRTSREAPAKRAIPPAMRRAPVCIFCKGSLSTLRLKRQQASCRRSLLSHQNKLHLSPALWLLKRLEKTAWPLQKSTLQSPYAYNETYSHSVTRGI